jgi:hypothetical protein
MVNVLYISVRPVAVASVAPRADAAWLRSLTSSFTGRPVCRSTTKCTAARTTISRSGSKSTTARSTRRRRSGSSPCPLCCAPGARTPHASLTPPQLPRLDTLHALQPVDIRDQHHRARHRPRPEAAAGAPTACTFTRAPAHARSLAAAPSPRALHAGEDHSVRRGHAVAGRAAHAGDAQVVDPHLGRVYPGDSRTVKRTHVVFIPTRLVLLAPRPLPPRRSASACALTYNDVAICYPLSSAGPAVEITTACTLGKPASGKRPSAIHSHSKHGAKPTCCMQRASDTGRCRRDSRARHDTSSRARWAGGIAQARLVPHSQSGPTGRPKCGHDQTCCLARYMPTACHISRNDLTEYIYFKRSPAASR